MTANTQSCYAVRHEARGDPQLSRSTRSACSYYEGASSFGDSPATVRQLPGGRGPLAARRGAGAAAVHALGRARLGQLRPGADDGHARRRRRERAIWSATAVHAVRDRADLADPRRPDQAAGRHPAAGTGRSEPRDTHQLRDAVQHPEPPGDQQVAARCSTTTSRRRRCARPRLRRRASPRSRWSTSWRTRRGWTRTSSGCRTSAPAQTEPVARRSRRPSVSSPTGSPRSPRRSCRARTSSPVAGSRSAGSRARRRAWSPTSHVNKKTGKILVNHVYSSQVAGLTVYLPGAENQMVGNMVMGASRALFEEVAFNRAAGDEPRLGDLPDHALRRQPERQLPGGAAHRPALDRLGRAARRSDRSRDRERVLRRDRRSHPHSADDTGRGFAPC